MEPPRRTRNLLPSFSPNAQPPLPSASTNPGEEPFLIRRDFKEFSARYQRLTTEEKKALIMSTRRKFWEGMLKQYGQRGDEAEEVRTADVERRVVDGASTTQ